jgi:hypothetical protein
MAKTTKYQQLQKAKASHCKGRTTKAALNKKEAAYIADAVKKGNKTKAEATASAKRVVSGGCSAGIAGTKRKATKRKPAKRKASKK